MGHERVGGLPRTRNWNAIGTLLERSADSSLAMPTQEIASRTLEAAKQTIPDVEADDSVTRSFQFLVLLSVASQRDDPATFLSNQGVALPNAVTPLALSLALRRWLSPVERLANQEFMTIARQATADTIAEWHREKSVGQTRLFESGVDAFECWRQASEGRGFSELARTFFSKFTNRYLNYFLGRIASERLSTVNQRESFARALEEHTSDIAKHAFETSHITQSFAAGWFNKNAIGEVPSDKQIQGFLHIAFGKIQEELRREGTAR